MALLLDGGGLRVALGDDDPPQVGAVLPRNVLPGRFASMIAEIDLAFSVARSEENSPAVIGHFHVIEVRPTAGMHADGGAQVDIVGLRTLRAHFHPPLEKLWLPVFERP